LPHKSCEYREFNILWRYFTWTRSPRIQIQRMMEMVSTLWYRIKTSSTMGSTPTAKQWFRYVW
jgi:hypothetical protein